MYLETSHFYDLFGSGNQESARRASFILDCLPNQSSIIDIGAGSGEISFQLARKGHRIYSFEPSPSMFSILADRIAQRKEIQNQISIFPVKLEELTCSLQGDLAFASSVFSHLSLEARSLILKGTHHHLKPDGKFIFNCVQFLASRTDKPLSKIGERAIGKTIYRHFDSSQQIDYFTRKVTWKFEIEYEGQCLKEYVEDFFIHMDSPESVRSLLQSEGFRIENIFGSFDGTPIEKNSPSFVVVAAR